MAQSSVFVAELRVSRAMGRYRVDIEGVTSSPGAILPSAVAALPSDPSPRADREQWLLKNLDALKSRGMNLTHALEAWRVRTPQATDWLASEPTRAREAIARAIRPANTASEGSKPLVIEGFSSPWILLEACRATQPTPDGYSPRIIVIEPDEMAFLDGLAAADLTTALSEPRLELFVGATAHARFAAWINAPQQQTTALPAQILRALAPAQQPSSALESALRSAHETQGQLHQTLLQSNTAHYASKSRAHWAARYATEEPLRVLLPISRYSTFVRRSAEDLAAALRLQGHEAFVLTEPDAHARLTTPAYLSAFDSFRPDLVVLINYTRRHMGPAVPAGVPFVCWVQDRMAHLFDPAAGAAQSECDFLLGHLHPDLFSHFGYPKRNRRFAFVPASTQRFHDGPIPESLRRRHECEVAYVSHQSETPEQFHARVAPMFASNPAARRALEPLQQAAIRWMDAADTDPAAPRPARQPLVDAALVEAGIPNADPRLAFTVFGNYLVPLMERLLRHHTLLWASRICERRNWRLRLHGRGWDRHPKLGRWAWGPPLRDDEELRAVYASAAANLHMSLNTNSHQRVYEGALSGGLVLRRGPSPDWELAKIGMMRLAAKQPPSKSMPDQSTVQEARMQDGADPLLYYAMRGIPPVFDEQGRPVYRRTQTAAVRGELLGFWPDVPLETIPDLVFPRARETLFHAETELEQQLARAIDDPDWRRNTIAAHRAATLRSCTYDQLASTLLAMVRSGLAPENTR